MVTRRPLVDEAALLAAASEVWKSLTRSDWMEAFLAHPRIGETRSVATLVDAIRKLVGSRTTKRNGLAKP